MNSKEYLEKLEEVLDQTVQPKIKKYDVSYIADAATKAIASGDKGLMSVGENSDQGFSIALYDVNKKTSDIGRVNSKLADIADKYNAILSKLNDYYAKGKEYEDNGIKTVVQLLKGASTANLEYISYVISNGIKLIANEVEIDPINKVFELYKAGEVGAVFETQSFLPNPLSLLTVFNKISEKIEIAIEDCAEANDGEIANANDFTDANNDDDLLGNIIVEEDEGSEDNDEEDELEKAAEEAVRQAEEEAKKAEEDKKKADNAKKDDLDIGTNDKLIDALLNNTTIKGKLASINLLASKIVDLYATNITGIPQIGLFKPSLDKNSVPLWKYKPSQNEAVPKPSQVFDTGTSIDNVICNVLLKEVPQLANYVPFDNKTGFPPYSAVEKGECYMLDAHIMFQSASIKFSGTVGRNNSITHWNTLTKAGIDTNKARIPNLDSFRSWVTWVLRRQYCHYIIEKFSKEKVEELLNAGDMSFIQYESELTKISVNFQKSLRNVIVVADRRADDNDQMKTTKLATLLANLNRDKIVANLVAEGALNEAGSQTVKAKSYFESKSEISTIEIAYNGVFEDSEYFSGEIVDSLVDAGVRTKWDNVLLGKDSNNNLIYHNFKKCTNASDYFYVVYADMGSGKGNMTLSLAAAALAGNCQLFYMDGKPDSGYGINLEAWSQGVESFFFDGQPRCMVKPWSNLSVSIQAEEMPYISNARSIQEKAVSLSSIPEELITGSTNENLEIATYELLGITRYIRAIEFWTKTLSKHTKDEWAVYIFDEVTSIHNLEVAVRQRLYKRALELVQDSGLPTSMLVTSVSSGKTVLRNFDFSKIKEKDKPKLEEAFSKHPALEYIKNWLLWTRSVEDGIPNIMKIVGRQAYATTFIIFQNAQWFADAEKGNGPNGATVIHAFAKAIGGSARKFIGRGALSAGCGSLWGNKPQIDSDWYKNYVNTSKAYWALTNSNSVTENNKDVMLFKPFSTWGFVLDENNVLCNENVKNYRRYFHYYINKLMELEGDTASNRLHNAYTFAERYISEHPSDFDLVEGARDSVKGFIYNAINFASAAGASKTGFGNAGQQSEQPSSEPNYDFMDNLGGNNQQQAEPNFTEQSVTNSNESPLDNLESEEINTDEMFNTQGVDSFTQQQQSQFDAPDFDDMVRQQLQPNQQQQQSRPDVNTEQPVVNNQFNDARDDGSNANNPFNQQDMFANLEAQYNIQNHLTKEEAAKTPPIGAQDNEVSYILDKTGEPVFDVSKIPAKQYIALSPQNSLRCPIRISASLIDSKPEKAWKIIGKSWKSFIDTIIKQNGGKYGIKNINIVGQGILVNNKFVRHNMFDNGIVSDFADIADMVYLLDHCKSLSGLLVSQQIWNKLMEQCEQYWQEAQLKAKQDLSFDEWLFGEYKSLNTVVVMNSLTGNKDEKPKLVVSRAGLIAKNKEKANKAFKEQLDACKKEVAAKQSINKAFSSYKHKHGKRDYNFGVKPHKRGFFSRLFKRH